MGTYLPTFTLETVIRGVIGSKSCKWYALEERIQLRNKGSGFLVTLTKFYEDQPSIRIFKFRLER